MVGDFGGGAMMLAFGMLAALLHARRTGEGQVVDCAMTDGSALLMSAIWGMRGMGMWSDERGVNLFDTGAHFYDTYKTRDGKYIAHGSIEPKFHTVLRAQAGLDGPEWDDHMNPVRWPALKEKLAAVIATRTRDEWCEAMEYGDACFAPVLSMAEAPAHPHNVTRATFIELDGITQPAPAPRYSRTPSPAPAMWNGEATASGNFTARRET